MKTYTFNGRLMAVKVPGTVISSREGARNYIGHLIRCFDEDRTAAMAKVVDEIESQLVQAGLIDWGTIEELEAI